MPCAAWIGCVTLLALLLALLALLAHLQHRSHQPLNPPPLLPLLLLLLLLSRHIAAAGAIYPEDGELSKSRGRRVAKPFGPIKDWKIVYSANAAPQVRRFQRTLFEK